MKNIMFLSFIFYFIIGCNSEFDPVIGFEDKIVVIGILDNRSETQFIKVQKTFDNINLDDSQKILKNLNIELYDNSNVVYNFKDTIIEGISNYAVYYNNNMRLHEGNYSLVIQANKYPLIFATNYPPGRSGSISYDGNTLLIILSSYANEYTYEYHIYIQYQQKLYNEWVNKKYEVPIQINISEDQKDTTVIYPSPRKEKSLENNTIRITNDNFIYAISKIEESVHSADLRAFKCFVIFTTIDANLYHYLFKGFNDKYSVRLDQLNLSTVIGGEGIFGAINIDSTEILNFLQNP